jgi:DNA-binding response OmpR family regulator
MSASGVEKERACSEVGADGFLDKPFDVEHLLATMRRMAPRRLEVV